MQITIYHNQESRFGPYADGHDLVAVASYRLDPHVFAPAATEFAVADWVFELCNLDLPMVETRADDRAGPTAFHVACIYRLLGCRSMSVGDVVKVHLGDDIWWLACDSSGWQPVSEPTNYTDLISMSQAVSDQLATRRRRGDGHV